MSDGLPDFDIGFGNANRFINHDRMGGSEVLNNGTPAGPYHYGARS